MFDERLWRPIPGYYPYEAYPTGEIRNGKTGRVLKPRSNRAQNDYRVKYPYYLVKINGKKMLVHRLIALTFLRTPGNIPVNELDVDHMDGNTENNRIENLRWLPKSINRALKRNTSVEKRRKLCEEYVRILKSFE